MKTDDWLFIATRKLNLSDISTARLDALVLLEDFSGKDRAWLLAHPELELSKEQLKTLDKQIERRSKHEPLAYIRGRSEFYGREFLVNQHTLEPRPESETIIELLKNLVSTNLKKQIFRVVDIGTGSGCLAVTAKLEFPELEILGSDIDKKCVQTAKENAKKHKVSIDFLQGNLLDPIIPRSYPGKWIVLANLPYVPDSHTINNAAMFEPESAIFGGPDGLDLYRNMFEQIDTIKVKPSYVLTESLPPQHKDLEKIAVGSGYKQIQQEDFIQVFAISEKV